MPSKIRLSLIVTLSGYLDFDSILIKTGVPFLELMLLFDTVTLVMFPLMYIPFPEAILIVLPWTNVFEAEIENSKACSPVIFLITLPIAVQFTVT